MLRAAAAAEVRSGSQCSGNVHIIAPVERSIAPTAVVSEESVAVALVAGQQPDPPPQSVSLLAGLLLINCKHN